jgi:2,3-bisphosphoglycerate-dependent phosphoglycerate mutase
MSTLILIRHGQSIWNAENRFTGWVNTPLSPLGVTEADAAGVRLAAEGVLVGAAFTSELARAQETGRRILAALGQDDLGQEVAWELNERFYGALTGRDKQQTREEFGVEQVHIWRRSFDTPPPGGESLADTTRRTLPYFRDRIVEATRQHDAILVSAHGNSLRAIVKELDGLDDQAITGVEIATGVPILYEMTDGVAAGKRILG